MTKKSITNYFVQKESPLEAVTPNFGIIQQVRAILNTNPAPVTLSLGGGGHEHIQPTLTKNEYNAFTGDI
eukprot:11319233-Ditylum_brightwellii.AAC.1